MTCLNTKLMFEMRVGFGCHANGMQTKMDVAAYGLRLAPDKKFVIYFFPPIQ